METDALDPLTTFVDALERAQAARRTRAELLAVVSSLMANDWKQTVSVDCTYTCKFALTPGRPCPHCKRIAPPVEFAIQSAKEIIAAVDAAAPTAATDNALAVARAGLIAAAKVGVAQYMARFETTEFDDENHGSEAETDGPREAVPVRFASLDNGNACLDADDLAHLGNVDGDSAIAIVREPEGEIVIVSTPTFMGWKR